MGRKKTERKVYQITLDRLSRKALEEIAWAEGTTFSHAISKTVMEYMHQHYPERMETLQTNIFEEKEI